MGGSLLEGRVRPVYEPIELSTAPTNIDDGRRTK
jgi:hypothetical protein